MFANRTIDGDGVTFDQDVLILDDDDAIERHRDLLALRYRALGLTHKQVGKILGLGVGTVHRRLSALPESIKRKHGAIPLAKRDPRRTAG